jgi:hypothetical protein
MSAERRANKQLAHPGGLTVFIHCVYFFKRV